MTFFLKYDVVSPKKIWGHLQTPLFTYKITYLAPLWGGLDKRLLGVGVVWTKDSLVPGLNQH